MIQKPKGTRDLLAEDVKKWLYVEGVIREITRKYGYSEIRTPMFEKTKLFKRGVGETTDIVQKEMYTVISDQGLGKFKAGTFDLDKESFTLKPEGTAPVVRAFVENKLYADAQPTKIFYLTPCFRHERPQAGRLRQFHQFGIEIFGSETATSDAEVIALADDLMKTLGLKDIHLEINSIGCPECRPAYDKLLKEYLVAHKTDLCETCNERIETNPLRVLDCKVPSCQPVIEGAPVITDHLCESCETHFESVKTYLEASEVPFVVNPYIVRGLDYYTKTAFEFISGDIGAQSTVCGGGRYDGLIQEVGGPATPGVGFGMGIERLIMTMEAQGLSFGEEEPIDIFIVIMGEAARRYAMKTAKKLRDLGLAVDIDHLGRSFKSQFKYADKTNARFTAVIGDNEVADEAVTLRNMRTGDQTEIDLKDLGAVKALVKEEK